MLECITGSALQKRHRTWKEEAISGVQVGKGGGLNSGRFSEMERVDEFESVLEEELPGLPTRLDAG